MQGRRLEETGGVFAGIRRGFLGTENDTDAGRSFAAVERHYSDRLLTTSCVSFERLWPAEISALPSKWQDATATLAGVRSLLEQPASQAQSSYRDSLTHPSQASLQRAEPEVCVSRMFYSFSSPYRHCRSALDRALRACQWPSDRLSSRHSATGGDGSSLLLLYGKQPVVPCPSFRSTWAYSPARRSIPEMFNFF